MTREENLNNFKSGFEKLRLALQNYPKQVFDYKPSPEKWSIREIIIHIADSEAVGYARCRTIIAESGNSILAYDQDKWAEKTFYNQLQMDLAMDLFHMLRINTCEVLKTIPDETWNNFMIHPERGKVTLDQWLEIYANHIDVHINQMNKNFTHWQNNKSTRG